MIISNNNFCDVSAYPNFPYLFVLKEIYTLNKKEMKKMLKIKKEEGLQFC